MYDDVRQLLNPGFLTNSVKVDDILLSLRTFNRADYFLLSNRAGAESRDVLDWIVASAVWMVDGQPVLEDPSAVYQICQTSKRFPKVIKSDLLLVIENLRERMSKAMTYLESFLYEEESRFLWRIYGTRINTATGVPGGERLGLNFLQESWIAYNEVEDQREQFQQKWLQAKLIASTMAPKGIKKLNNSDQAAQRQLDEQREEAQTQAYYQWIGREDLVRKTDSAGGVYTERYSARTVEDLQEEYRKWCLGIKDEHDLIVEDYKAKIRAKIESERRKRQERIELVERTLEAEGLKEPSLRPLLRDVEPLSLRTVRGKRVYADKKEHLYDRYLKHEAKPGTIEMRQGIPVSIPQDSLQEQVASRKPRGD